MPSYDKEKLLLMLEEQRASMRTIQDFSERIRERRAIMQKQKQYLQSCALHAGAEEFWQYLLQLPLEQAVALPREEVESYQGAVHTLGGKLNKRYTSGISKGSWDDFNKTRLQLHRLEGSMSVPRLFMTSVLRACQCCCVRSMNGVSQIQKKSCEV